MMAQENTKYQNLFGNYMAIQLPVNAKDTSDLRPVPDNQEVFCHDVTDQSIIIEIMEYVDGPEEEALKTHFEDVAGSNEAQESDLIGMEKIPQDQLAMKECSDAFFLSGKQRVAKFKETAVNTVNIHLGIFRLPHFETDILVTFNDPINIDPDSSSHCAIPVHSQHWTLEDFRNCLQSLQILNTELFVTN